MTRKMASLTLSFGMVQIPFGIAKASAVDTPDLKSLCECGATLGYVDDPIECNDDECDERYSWWNAVPGKGFELGDEMVPIDPDDLPDEPPVETGNVEKVVAVKSVLLEYAVEGNYYLLPDDEFGDQYGALVAALNEADLAILSYVQLRSKTRRYAIVAEGGVLLALQLADKKALPTLDYGTDEGMESQATQMLDSMHDADASLPDVEGQGIKDLVREQVDAQMVPDDEDAIAKEV